MFEAVPDPNWVARPSNYAREIEVVEPTQERLDETRKRGKRLEREDGDAWRESDREHQPIC
jgi:hypothetical protein